jgi:histidyl-tRNA synthetase
MGIERLIELMKGQGEPAEPSQCDVYMVHQGEEARMQAFVLAERMRDAGLDVVLHCATPAGRGQLQEPDEEGRRQRRVLRRDHRRGRSRERQRRREIAARRSRRQQQASVAFDAVVDYLVDQVVGAHATTTTTSTCITTRNPININ